MASSSLFSQPSSPPPEAETPQEQQQMVVKGELGRALLLPRIPPLVFLLSQQTPYQEPAPGCYKTMREQATKECFNCDANKTRKFLLMVVNTKVRLLHYKHLSRKNVHLEIASKFKVLY